MARSLQVKMAGCPYVGRRCAGGADARADGVLWHHCASWNKLRPTQQALCASLSVSPTMVVPEWARPWIERISVGSVRAAVAAAATSSVACNIASIQRPSFSNRAPTTPRSQRARRKGPRGQLRRSSSWRGGACRVWSGALLTTSQQLSSHNAQFPWSGHLWILTLLRSSDSSSPF